MSGPADSSAMHLVRAGRIVRALRRDRGWRQVDLARAAASSQQVVSLIETGRGNRASLRALDRIVHALDAELEIVIRWRGGQVERLLDEAHARLVALAADRLETIGWIVRLEVSYAFGRAIGSIDFLALHLARRTLIVGEVKSEILSAEATLRRHDEKVRVARAVAMERFGWDALSVSPVLVVPASTTSRRALERHAGVFGRAYPVRGAALSAWLHDPHTDVAAVLLVSDTTPDGGRRDLTSRRRVRSATRAARCA